MRVFSHPLRLDNAGALVSIEDDSDRHAAQLAGITLSTIVGERGLAPAYGLKDPIGTNVNLGVIAATVTRCEPDLAVIDSTITTTATGASIKLAVAWAE